METFALIMAIEEYPNAQTMAKKLEGTTKNAERLVEWLLNPSSGVSQQNIVFCGTESKYRTHGTTRTEIKQAICQLIQMGMNKTERLYVYLSGHGVMIPGQRMEHHQDVLLCSDFVTSAKSGDACIRLDELTMLLARCLGYGTHLTFMDACRNSDHELSPTGLELNCKNPNGLEANRFQILSTNAGRTAANNSQFIDVLLNSLDGKANPQTLVQDKKGDGLYWITFRSVQYAIEARFAKHDRIAEFRNQSELSDYPICSTLVPGQTATIISPSEIKVPPIELLVAYDEIIFLGETNGQLPTYLKLAYEKRGEVPWKRLDIFSIDDLTKAGRPGVALSKLEEERQSAEDYFQKNATDLGQKLFLYRYGYRGTYGSMWQGSDERRRVHVSPRIEGVNIRQSPSQDYIDFANNRHPMVDLYFKIAREAIENTQSFFRYGEG